jgi:hypothetical protein
MEKGTFWFVNNSKFAILNGAIKNAVKQYTLEHGIPPNLCLVHPNIYDIEAYVEGLEIKPSKSVLPSYFWIGVKE